jgi:trimeric autotransporter adhesin
MIRRAFVLFAVLLTWLVAGCGGGTSGSGGGGGTPQDIPTLTAIAPSSAPAGTSAITLVLYGSNFENGAIAQWNGAARESTWVSATEITTTILAGDLATVGSVKVTVSNPAPAGGTSAGSSAAQTFMITAVAAATTRVRSVAGITTAQNIVWDASHGNLYVAIPSSDTTIPNTIVPINPVTGSAGTPVAAGNNPDMLSISSDSSYLWVGLDGDNAVQRFLLPKLTKDISFPVPTDAGHNPQQAVSMQAAPVSPHTLALVAGKWEDDGAGNGVYVYDDAKQRPTSVPAFNAGGPWIDWIQWGANDLTIYGDQYTTIDAGGVGTLSVAATGVTAKSYNGGQVGPSYSHYDKKKGLLYSFGQAFDPVDGSLVGSFSYPVGESACTADSTLGRFYCVVAYSDGGTDVNLFELWVFDLNSYALIDRVYFGASAGAEASSVTGTLQQLVRWGNAGLALTTNTGPYYYGNGGLFLIDGAAINPNAVADVTSGAPTSPYSWLASVTPQAAPAGSENVSVTLNGNNFTPSSTACWNCNYLQFNFFPTAYVSPQQLSVTIPTSQLAPRGSCRSAYLIPALTYFRAIP